VWQSQRVHLLIETERYMINSKATDDEVANKAKQLLPGSVYFYNLQDFFTENCFQSPLSGQGMIILAAIISSRVAFK
jgi:hypothetical protein